MEAPPVSIDFDVDFEGLVAFGKHYYSRSPLVKKFRLGGKILGVLLAVGLTAGGAVLFLRHGPVPVAVALQQAGVIMIVLVLVLWDWRYEERVERLLRRQWRNQREVSGLGRQHLEARPDGLYNSSADGFSLKHWSNVRLETGADEMRYIFVSPNSGYAVRPTHVVGGDLHRFLQEVAARTGTSP